MKPKSETVTLWDDVLSESRAMRSSCLSLACRHMYSSNSTNVSKKKNCFHLPLGGRWQEVDLNIL
jgi:hypothetical protein